MDPVDPTNPALEIAVYLAGIHLFEEQLGLKRDTLLNVSDDDDWSAVIKCHALIESSITLLLSHALDQRLAPVLAMLELSKPDTGKLEFTKALELLTSEHRKFIRELSRLRNLLAHDLAFIGFSLSDYIARMDKNRKKSFFDAMTGPSKPDRRQALVAAFEANPRRALMVPVLQVVLAVNAKTLITRKEHMQRIGELVRQYLRSSEPTESQAEIQGETR